MPPRNEAAPAPTTRRPPLRPGDWVEVRSPEEIAATLDATGALDGMPFMPEMRRFCGRRFRVASRADRTFAEKTGIRRLPGGAVHLEHVRCDGAAHDGCGRSCLVFWKEWWLRRVTPGEEPRGPAGVPVELPTRRGDRYHCQGTALPEVTTPLSWREWGQYLRAVRDEDRTAWDMCRALAIQVRNRVGQRLGVRDWNLVPGACADGTTPSLRLALQPGERVRIRSEGEIRATLDAHGWNRRMEFSREMLRHCGEVHTVLRRVDRIIRDHNGRMNRIEDTVILEGLVYKDLSRLATPRSEYMFWRECWLERA